MQLIFVTGTARSGTSAMATLLERMGCRTLPKTVAGSWNKDYQENAVLNALCEHIHPWHKIAAKRDVTKQVNAIASYIIEHSRDSIAPLVLKSPTFPFIIPELRMVADVIAEQTGRECKTHFACTRRHVEPQVESLMKFTHGAWSKGHWRELIDVAAQRIADQEDDSFALYRYGVLVTSWQIYARKINALYPQLTIPEDGGIDPALNHHPEHGREEAKAI